MAAWHVASSERKAERLSLVIGVGVTGWTVILGCLSGGASGIAQDPYCHATVSAEAHVYYDVEKWCAAIKDELERGRIPDIWDLLEKSRRSPSAESSTSSTPNLERPVTQPKGRSGTGSTGPRDTRPTKKAKPRKPPPVVQPSREVRKAVRRPVAGIKPRTAERPRLGKKHTKPLTSRPSDRGRHRESPERSPTALPSPVHHPVPSAAYDHDRSPQPSSSGVGVLVNKRPVEQRSRTSPPDKRRDFAAVAHAGSAALFGVLVMTVSAVLIRRFRPISARADAGVQSSTFLPAPAIPVIGGDRDSRASWKATDQSFAAVQTVMDVAAPTAAVADCAGQVGERPPAAVAVRDTVAAEVLLAPARLSVHVTGRLFGATRVRAGERTVCFSRAEGRDLFALLAVSKDGELQDVVIERLWPDEGEHGLRHLETGVRDINAGMRLATGLSANVKFVVKTGQRRHLASAYFDVDLWRFDEAYLLANTAAEQGARVQALRQMVGLYEGPLLADRDDLWCLPLRQAAARHAMNAVMRLAELEHKNEPDYALDLLTLAVDRIDPYSEVLWCQIMTIQGQLNRLPAVRAAFQQFTERLKEIDTEPSHQAKQVYQRITEGK